ncbi:hypothetical protein J23TS9_25930 [Paenibacillus sp. J23TS9]|nr:hypothetical protein J23TS9_25930 [Paenibacillus sp. J23TS9]
MTALDEYVSGNDISNLHMFNHSSVLPLKEQYANEARFIYGETEAYKVYNETMENLSVDEKEKRFSDIEEIYKQISSCIHQDPSSDDVQRLIEEWKEKKI